MLCSVLVGYGFNFKLGWILMINNWPWLPSQPSLNWEPGKRFCECEGGTYIDQFNTRVYTGSINQIGNGVKRAPDFFFFYKPCLKIDIQQKWALPRSVNWPWFHEIHSFHLHARSETMLGNILRQKKHKLVHVNWPKYIHKQYGERLRWQNTQK